MVAEVGGSSPLGHPTGNTSSEALPDDIGKGLWRVCEYGRSRHEREANSGNCSEDEAPNCRTSLTRTASVT